MGFGAGKALASLAAGAYTCGASSSGGVGMALIGRAGVCGQARRGGEHEGEGRDV